MPSRIIPSDWDDGLYLKNNPDVRYAVERGTDGTLLSGYDHYVRYGIVEGRRGAWTRKAAANSAVTDETAIAELAEKSLLPSWAVEEMLRQSQFDTSLNPTKNISFPAYDVFNKSEWGRSLREVCRGLRHAEYDYMFLVPWVRRGGADLASILHVQSVARGPNRIVVVTTGNARSDWLHRLPQTVDVIQFNEALGAIPLDYQALACYHLIVALAPKRVHIINSQPGWKLLVDSSRTLAGLSELYVSLYCYDYRISGEPVGYARDIRRCAQDVKRIFTDNSEFARHLVACVGVEASKVTVLRHPVAQELDLPPPVLHSRRVLWASRLDRQKRPALLVEIARRLPSLIFDVYGAAVLEDSDAILKAFERCPNIVYRGEFDKLSQVITDNYRLFLYTSAWDGLPNIVLEAMSAGMLVIAGAVGGVGADIGSRHCILVNETDSPDAYVRAIKQTYAAADGAEPIRLAGKSFIRSNHTFARFVSDLRTAGYIDSSQTAEELRPATAPKGPVADAKAIDWPTIQVNADGHRLSGAASRKNANPTNGNGMKQGPKRLKDVAGVSTKKHVLQS